ncbi:MAG: hypothetical protein M3323_05235 [Actinomycetota bacterium]|nr:hypothetical protein [Actinomycetota bacterium]
MILGRFSTRTVLFGSAAMLMSIVVGGGALLGLAEDVGIGSGIWLGFNVVTTTGFGSGPATAAGRFLSMGMFAAGVVCWFGLLVTAIEIANMRFQKHALIDEALRPLARRRGSRLFHVN